MSRMVPGLLAAGVALGLSCGAALAQEPVPPYPPAPQPLAAQPVPLSYQPAFYDGYELIPPAVYGGPAFGYSGYGYYYDGPGEGPLVAPSGSRRVVHRKRHR